MALAALLESLEGVSEAIAAEYVEQEIERDGETKKVYVLDVTPVDGLELQNVTELKSIVQKERKATREAKSLLERFGDLDPAEAKKALATLKKLGDPDKLTPEDKVKHKVSSAVEQAVEKYQRENDELKGEVNTLTSALEDALIDSRAAIAAPEGASLKLLLPHIRKRTKIEKGEDGKYKTIVVGPDGEKLMTRKGVSQDDMDLKELMEIMSEEDDLAPAFAPVGGGGGTKTSKSTSTRQDLSELPPVERLKVLRQQGR